jgi:hypothetical protein
MKRMRLVVQSTNKYLKDFINQMLTHIDVEELKAVDFKIRI